MLGAVNASVRISPAWLAAVLLCCCAALHADIIRLKNGKVLRGEVIKEDDTYVVVKVPSGEIKLRVADIEEIERQSSSEYRSELGRQLLQERRYERAIQAFEEAVESNKDDRDARRLLANGYYEQGKHYREMKRFREARDAYEKLLKLDPRRELIDHNAAKILGDLTTQDGNLQKMQARARELADERNWAGAIAAYDEMLNFTPDAKALIAPEMAQCHVARAVDHAHKQQVFNAAADLESALKLDPTLADKLEAFYTSCALPIILSSAQRGDLQAAHVDLKRVLHYAPTNKGVLYVAGRLDEAAGKIASAGDSYAKALGSRVANPTPEYVGELRRKVETALNIQGDKWQIDSTLADASAYTASSDGPQEKLETDNFVIYHYNDALARQVADSAEYHLTRVSSELNLNKAWKEKTKIFIHRTQAVYTARTAQPEWTGGISKFSGISNGKLLDPQIHSWQTSPRLLKSVLPHEIAHLVVNSNLSNFNALPRALHEGFAVLMEPDFRRDSYMYFLRVRLRSQDFISLTDLLTLKDYPADPEFFYAEGYAIVAYAAQLKGVAAAVELIRKTQTSANVLNELLQVTGHSSVQELEKQWKKWILADSKVEKLERK